jgi:hypothetical protein
MCRPEDCAAPDSIVATLLALSIEEEHSQSPERIKAVEPCQMFLNVSFYRKEILWRNSAVF